VHSKEHLLTDIIDPNRSVEANYRQYTVHLRKGTYITGLLAAETRTAIELFDVEGKKQTLLREDVAEITTTNKSLMPEGFEKQISPKELVDLLEFLTQRGRYLPLPLDRFATAISTRGMFYSEAAPAERLVFSDWGPKTFNGVPFRLIDPQVDRVPNVVLLYGPQGQLPPKMPKTISIPCNSALKAVHILGGVSGWGFPLGEKGSVSLIVRFHYAGGETEEHPLINGEHLADYIRRVDVPGSQFAFDLRGRQVRYLSVAALRRSVIDTIEFAKGRDATAPIIVAATLEGLD
jgi:putative heme-binding domain-containing protein